MVKTAHAFTLVVLGWLMQMVPALLPEQFMPTVSGLESTSGLWLEFMGWINVGFGVLFILNLQVLPFAARIMAWRPEGLPEMARASRSAKTAIARMPDNLMRPALRLEARVAAAVAARRPQPAPVRVNDRAVA